MESNWRFNVWDYGLWGSDYELVARSLELPDELAFGWGPIGPDGFRYLDISRPGEVPVVFQTAPRTPADRFPLGKLVEPD